MTVSASCWRKFSIAGRERRGSPCLWENPPTRCRKASRSGRPCFQRQARGATTRAAIIPCPSAHRCSRWRMERWYWHRTFLSRQRRLHRSRRRPHHHVLSPVRYQRAGRTGRQERRSPGAGRNDRALNRPASVFRSAMARCQDRSPFRARGSRQNPRNIESIRSAHVVPANAAFSAAMSILTIFIIASDARLAFTRSVEAIISKSTVGTICHDSP